LVGTAYQLGIDGAYMPSIHACMLLGPNVSIGSISTDSALQRHFRFSPNIDRGADIPDWQLRADFVAEVG
jgi:hypothetical protein